jgi:hypothetical protein
MHPSRNRLPTTQNRFHPVAQHHELQNSCPTCEIFVGDVECEEAVTTLEGHHHRLMNQARRRWMWLMKRLFHQNHHQAVARRLLDPNQTDLPETSQPRGVIYLPNFRFHKVVMMSKAKIKGHLWRVLTSSWIQIRMTILTDLQ